MIVPSTNGAVESTNGSGTGTALATKPYVLELDNIGVRFGGVIGLDGVSLRVSEGEVCGLIGPNGAGKTTLFDVISGMRTPQNGSVTVDGVDVTGLRRPSGPDEASAGLSSGCRPSGGSASRTTS